MAGHTPWPVVKATRQAAGRADRADEDDWTDGITVAVMAERFTPQQAARIKYRAAVMQLATVPDDRIERMLRWDPGHQWFLFCLDAVARRAP